MKLLFACTHNRCRSILAEAIARHVSGTKIIAKSAGRSLQGEVHPLTLKYLAEHQTLFDNTISILERRVRASLAGDVLSQTLSRIAAQID
ncbi:MAG: protein-tyrosine-phosphatase [Alcanivorax sp.]|jgi:protein-tyrosine-phosphatase